VSYKPYVELFQQFTNLMEMFTAWVAQIIREDGALRRKNHLLIGDILGVQNPHYASSLKPGKETRMSANSGH